MNFKRYKLLLITLGLFTLNACTPEEKTNSLDKRYEQAAANYADIVLANYKDTYNEAVKLQHLVNDFVENPTEEKFEACKNQWLASRIPYGQTEAFRFYGGPIDNAEGPEGLINAWPMDENFIDYVEGNPDAGLINDPETYPVIDKNVLMELNESISETSIFTGYHAIEFLLWGQDLYSESAGQRPYTDYVADGTAKNPERRGEYLKAITDLLVENLRQVLGQWETDGAYRAEFLDYSKKEMLTKVFTSLGELSKGELSGERMFVAVDSKDQENEHSCFSDNTINDIKMNFQGIVNVYTGSYTTLDATTVSGESFASIAKDVNAEKAQAAEEAIALAREKINAIPAPFDQAIINHQDKVLEAVTALEDLSDYFADVQHALAAQ